MAINLPRYSKDSPVDLVDGAYGAAMGRIENELSNVSTAVTKSEQALSTAEQAKTSVLQQQEEIDRIRGDLDGLIAGGGEASVPIVTTEKAGIVKPDGATLSVKQDGGSSAPAPSSTTSGTMSNGAHTHTVTVTSNTHTHDISANGKHTHALTINSAGSNGTGKNMPAYMAVNMWQRVS